MTFDKNEIVNVAIETVLKLVLLGVVLYWSLLILKPFIVLVIWAVIIAVSVAPFIGTLEAKVRLQRRWIVALFTTVVIAILVVPTYLVSDSLIVSSSKMVKEIKEGTYKITPPSEKVKSWPIIGEKTYTLWSESATNLDKTIERFRPEIKEYSPKVASSILGAFGTVLQFIVSMIIASVFLIKSEGSVKVYHAISTRLLGQKGVEWATLSALTIRSVVQGVIGIALIQSFLALIGLILIEVPFAPLWAFVVLFLAIIQLPPILILGPIIAYVFSYAETTPATIFAVYAIFVSVSDGFLKPLLLGRGVDIPMLVILLGAIGGMILSGIIGLFVGAVVLALGYKLFMTWLEAELKSDTKSISE